MDLFPLSIESTSALQGIQLGITSYWHTYLINIRNVVRQTECHSTYTPWISTDIPCVDWHCVLIKIHQCMCFSTDIQYLYLHAWCVCRSRHYMSICCCVTVSNCYRRKLCFYREQLLLKGETCPKEIHTFPLIHTFIKSKYLQHIQRFIVNL